MRKKSVKILSIFIIYLIGLSPTILANDTKALNIMIKVNERDTGKNAIIHLDMILIDKNKHQRKRQLISYRKEVNFGKKALIFFLSPPQIKNTGLLTFDYDDGTKNDDQWLYLPELHKAKRIASQDKSGRFMGSDFSYFDLTDLTIENYTFTFMKDVVIRGKKAWQILAIPNTKSEENISGYKKRILFVSHDNYVIIRQLLVLKSGDKRKYFDIKKLEKIDGIWVPTDMYMTTKRGGLTIHKTIIKQSQISFKTPLEESMFRIRRLEKGF